MPKAQFDEQGRLFWHLVKAAGWTEKRVNALLLKRFGATHWNALESGQRRAAINMLKSYAAAAEKVQSKMLRQKIMIMVRKAGRDLDWLHDVMEAWGFGRSLRELNFPQTVEVHRSVMSATRTGEPGAGEAGGGK